MATVVLVFPEEEWVTGVVAQIVTRLRDAVRERGRATLLLSGGSTPAPVYQALAEAEGVEWAKVHFFWGDERDVPPDDPESNFRMVREALLDPLGIAPDDPRVHRIPTESPTPPADAALYEQNLRFFFDLGLDELPRFDVVLLGMGDDGHTASLFPETEALTERKHLVVANPVPALNTTRLTVTFPVLNAARTVLLLVRGADKAERLAEVLDGPSETFPIQGVSPTEGEYFWMLDRPAAAFLPPATHPHQ